MSTRPRASPGSPSGDFGAGGASEAGDAAINSKYRGAQGLPPEFIAELEKQFGFDKPPLERFGLMLWNFLRFDFGESYFRDTPVLSLIAREAARLDLARALDDAALLPDLDPARDPKGGARRVEFRRLDVRRHHRRLCGAGLPLRDLPHRVLRRRQLLRLVPAARADLRQLGAALLAGADRRLFLAPGAAARGDGARRLRHDDAAHQELVPRRDPQAVRDHGAGEGTERAAGALRACFPQRHADRHRRLSGRVHLGVLRRLAADRDDLLARWARLAQLREHHGPRLSRGLREPLHLLAARRCSCSSSPT